MNKYKLTIITPASTTEELIVEADTMVQAINSISEGTRVLTVTDMKSLCKCCAKNMEEFPKVLCRHSPYSDEISPVTTCGDYITEEDEENILSAIYRTYTEKQWDMLTTSYRKVFSYRYKA